jgi:hypothetical protein
VARDVLTQTMVVCDDRQLAARTGALGNVGLGSQHITAEFGDVLAGRLPAVGAPADHRLRRHRPALHGT